MKELYEAERIIKEYPLPNSSIDNGNLYFAATTYQKEFNKMCEFIKDFTGILMTKDNIEAVTVAIKKLVDVDRTSTK